MYPQWRSLLPFFGILLIPLTAFSQETWLHFDIADPLTGISGNDSDLWMSSADSGILRFDLRTGQIQDLASGAQPLPALTCIRVADGVLYAGSENKGLFFVQNDSIFSFDILNSPLPSDHIADIAADPLNHALWIATENGLAEYGGGVWQIFTTDNSGLPENNITCVFADSGGRLWAGTQSNGLALFDGTDWRVFNYDNAGINSNHIRTVSEDQSGIIYVADDAGVDLYNPASDAWIYVYNTFTTQISDNLVNHMLSTSDGSLWFATDGGITRRDSGNNWTIFTMQSAEIPSDTVNDLFEDAGQTIWFATSKGLTAYTGNVSALSAFSPAFSLFPDPAQDILYLDYINNGRSGMQVSVYNAEGECMLHERPENDFYGEVLVPLHISALAAGIYFCVLEDDAVHVTKVFVKR